MNTWVHLTWGLGGKWIMEVGFYTIDPRSSGVASRTDWLVEHVKVGQKQGKLLNVEHGTEVSMVSSRMSCLLISMPSFQKDVHIMVQQAT
jgi:hypothetical protein